jgi:hypothetical protein
VATLEAELTQDPCVVVMEQENASCVKLPRRSSGSEGAGPRKVRTVEDVGVSLSQDKTQLGCDSLRDGCEARPLRSTVGNGSKVD